MADVAKYAPINGGNLISDFKSHFSIFRTRKTISFAYVFIFFFIAFTIFLAFTPSSNSSAPWFSSIFTLPSTSNSSSLSSPSLISDQSYGSRFYGYFFPNSSSPQPSQNSSLPQNARSSNSSLIQQDFTKTEDPPHKVEVLKQNQTITLDKVEALKANQSTLANSTVNFKNVSSRNEDPPHKVEVLKQNQTRIQDKVEVLKQNQRTDASFKNVSSTNGEKGGVVEKGSLKNLTSSLMKKKSNGTNVKKGGDDLIESLMNCDFFDGNWVRDDSYPLYKPGSCSLIDEQFNCFANGRPDNGYLKLKWKPKGCTLPRLDGSHMLEMLRGKRLVFVGDSLNRNMWESLICILRNSVKDQKKVYEEFGRHHFRAEASYSFLFEDYKFTVEFFVTPFLVQEWELVVKNGTKKETLRLDLVSKTASKYKNADIIVFNTGHWWTHDKTSLGKDYYQEGTHVYSDLNVLEAFRKALTTWGRWIDANVNPKKSLVFFRGYSASHFSGGQWNSGGQCDHENEPIKNDTYLTPYPPKMVVLEKVLKGMKTPVTYLNVTRMTDYRKDGHPSVYRRLNMSEEEKIKPLQFQDCSHWCLPGVPDVWNEILYAELLVKLKQQEKHS